MEVVVPLNVVVDVVVLARGIQVHRHVLIVETDVALPAVTTQHLLRVVIVPLIVHPNVLRPVQMHVKHKHRNLVPIAHPIVHLNVHKPVQMHVKHKHRKHVPIVRPTVVLDVVAVVRRIVVAIAECNVLRPVVVVAVEIVLGVVRMNVRAVHMLIHLGVQFVCIVVIHIVQTPVLIIVTPHVRIMEERANRIKENDPGWKNGSAKSITFIVTKDCQLACKYCYLVGKNTKERMTWEVAKKAIDYILNHEDEFREESVIWDFIGGEPFIEIDLIDKICDYLKIEMYRRNHHWFNSYRFSFSTNGINYHTEKVQRFIEKNHSHLSIGITIDGTKRKHDLNRVWKDSEQGSYDDVVKNIPKWLEQFPEAGTKVTISSEDIPYIKESVLHLYELGIKEVNINCVFEDVWKEGDDVLFEEQLTKLADDIINGELYHDHACSFYQEFIGKPMDRERDNQNWCGAGKMLSIDAAGNFYPCTRFAQYSLRSKPAWIIGNIKDGIDQNRLRPFLTLDRTTQSSQECVDCEVASGCAWCQGENYDAADTHTIFQRATAICKMHKARVRANNYYWNKLYRKLELEGEREEFERSKRNVKLETC